MTLPLPSAPGQFPDWLHDIAPEGASPQALQALWTAIQKSAHAEMPHTAQTPAEREQDWQRLAVALRERQASEARTSIPAANDSFWLRRGVLRAMGIGSLAAGLTWLGWMRTPLDEPDFPVAWANTEPDAVRGNIATWQVKSANPRADAARLAKKLHAASVVFDARSASPSTASLEFAAPAELNVWMRERHPDARIDGQLKTGKLVRVQFSR